MLDKKDIIAMFALMGFILTILGLAFLSIEATVAAAIIATSGGCTMLGAGLLASEI